MQEIQVDQVVEVDILIQVVEQEELEILRQ
jgi:hypothetical protein